jgi:hypothetical protein
VTNKRYFRDLAGIEVAGSIAEPQRHRNSGWGRDMKKISACVLLWCSIVQPDLIRARQIQTQTPSENCRIPFDLRSGFLIVVEGRIEQLKGLKFILDTGASHSVIDKKVANKLSLRCDPLFNFDKYVAVEWADFHEVQVGPVEVRDASLMVGDLAQYSELAYDADLILQVMVQGYPVHLLVDSGLERILLYEDRIRKRFPSLKLEEEKDGVSLGRLHVRQANLPGVGLGTAASRPMVLLMKGPSADQLVGIDGYLGLNALQARQIEFNFETHTLAWRE